jgi:hypothetical protein
MTLTEKDIRWLIAAPLVVFLAAVGASLWFVDLLSHQGEFAALVAAELVAFALLLYLERTPDYSEASKTWLLGGCVSIVVFLAIAIL